MCSIATIHFEKLKNPSTNAHNELTGEQELFCNILQTVVSPPFSIHAQCQTVESSLPTAKFYLLVNHPIPDPSLSPASSCEVAMVLNGRSREDVVMSNKTDTTLNLHALNASLALEGLIFAELNDNRAVTLISGGQSYFRPLFRFKECDCLFTLPSVMQWCNTSDSLMNICGCILFLLC